MADPTITVSYYTGLAWVDISAYVLSSGGISGKWGMSSNDYNDRLAKTGEMRLVLKNLIGEFDPEDADALAGWGINTKVKLEVTFDGTTWRRFYGTVQSLKFSDPSTYEHTATATVSDWMNYAYMYRLDDQSIETYRRGGYVSDKIVDAVGQAPLNTAFEVGDYEFPATFDSVSIGTKAATELNKIALSESGYFYNKHDKINGETLVFEAESTRNSTRTVSKIPVMAASSGYWLTEGDDYVLTEGSDKVILDAVQNAHINGTGNAYFRTHGDNIINKVTVTAYPKRADSTEQTIYSLGTPIYLMQGETKTINVKYQNLSTKESCNAVSSLCSQPVATTDYLMNTNSAGTGTNSTADLTISVVFHTSSADITMTNTGFYPGYVTRLYLKGFSVYQDSSIKYVSENAASQLAYGTTELNIEQQYQRDVIAGESRANKIVWSEKSPRTKLEKVTMVANKSDVLMLSFLAMDIGDLVTITESDLNLADNYYINGIEFSISSKNIITYSWILREPDYVIDYTGIQLEFTNIDNQYIQFYNAASGLTQKTIIGDFYLDSWGDTSVGAYILNKGLEHWMVYLGTTSHRLIFNRATSVYDTAGSGWAGGSWITDVNSVNSTTDTEFAITFDESSVANNPIIYLDGSSVTVTESATPTGAFANDANMSLEIGSYVNSIATRKSIDGKVKNIRIFNRILSAAEVAAEYATPNSVTNGLVWKSPGVPTTILSEYEDLTLTSTTKIYDEIGGKAGTPYGSPIARLIP